MKTIERRTFLIRSLASLGGLVVAGNLDSTSRLFAAPRRRAASPPPAAVPPKSPPPTVVEILMMSFPPPTSGKWSDQLPEEAIFASAISLTKNDLAPLDALSEVYPDDPPVAIFVDTGSEAPTTRMLAMKLAASLADMGSSLPSVGVVGSTDDALRQAGYVVVRSKEGSYAHGADTDSDFGQPTTVPTLGRPVRFSRALERPGRAAVVARLGRAGGSMAPFAVDTGLLAVDPRSRSEASKNPEFGARLLASQAFSGRFGLVLGDLIEIPIDSPTMEPFKSGSILAGRSVLAVESIGHTILSNTCEAKGIPVPPPHPILAAARKLGLTGARTDSIDWRKQVR